MRRLIPFNDNWLYAPAVLNMADPDSAFVPITLPHTNIELPHHNFDNAEYQFVSTYRKRFKLPEPLNGRRVFLDFDGAMIAATVSINGHTFGEHPGGYTPFSFDITDYLIEDGDNLLTVQLDSTERPDIPPYGGVVDYLTFGGIYREVWLRYVTPVFIEDVFVRTDNVLTDNARAEVDVYVRNDSSAAVTAQLAVLLNVGKTDDSGSITVIRNASVEVQAAAQATTKTTVALDDLGKVELWTLDNPARYGLGVTLDLPGGANDDYGAIPFGFREAQFRDDGFYLNGELVHLIGLNRHQTYPYIGAAAPKRLQEKDADIIKYELGCNIVRTSHYPQSQHFIRRCDEIGLLVFEEIPGWQHIGDDDWQAISLRDVEAMIKRDRNHPSIVLWGVRINESGDNTAFYTRTNAIAHELDPTRQTGGVRFWQHSEFLEDVYTFNDFSNTVQDPVQTPHLITEFNGHMFPTKTWDQEERAVEHALRHARIQDKQIGTEGVSGAIGWCAFDYNTHREFGSGDRICYHGVMDMFRLPKFAAYCYESQIDPAIRPVLQVASYWTMGDRSEGGIDPLVIFSNCDEIDLYVGESHVGRYQPDRENFPNLPHAPYTITDIKMLWGQLAFDDLRLVGYVNGEAVAEQRVSGDGLPHELVLQADDSELHADGADMTRLVFRIVDEYGNRLPYTNQVVTFSIDGPATLVGENPFAIMGGQAALYVRAGHEPGTVTIRAETPRLSPAEVTITLR